MTERRTSRALAAARAATSSTTAASTSMATTTSKAGRWDRRRVEAAAAVFADLQRRPTFDRAAVAERLALWYRFVDVVADGRVDADALDVAAVVVRAGVAWLEANPGLRHIGGRRWSVDDVEGIARWFGASRQRRAGTDDVARVRAFERVVRTGLVVDEAVPLATVLLDQLEAWALPR